MNLQTNPQPQILQVREFDVNPNSLPLRVDITGQEVTNATLHVYSARIDGNYKTTLQNTGNFPLIKTRLPTNHATLETFNVYDNPRTLGLIKRGNTVTLNQAWTITGPIDVLWNLIQILLTGTAQTHQTIHLTALAYQKTYNADLRIPIRGVTIQWN